MPARKTKEPILNVIDIGTSKVCAAIARVDAQHEVDILGIGVSECEGMKKGLVTDLEQVTRSVYRAVSAAEKMADRVVESAFVSISGAHLTTNTGHGVVNAQNQHGITAEDVRRAVESTKSLRLPPDKEIVAVFEQDYSIDGHEGIREPQGMSGSRLDAHVQVLTGASAPIHNLVKSVCRLDITVRGLIPSALASGEAVLNDDEKDIGVVVIDIGGGTTDVALFKKGCLTRAFVIPVGGDHIDNDIVAGLSASISEARRIKLKHGIALPEPPEEVEPVELKLVGREDTTQVPLGMLCEVIYPRVRELFHIVLKELESDAPIVTIPGGVVLTGGTARLPGIDRVAEKIMNTHIRIGAPRGVRGNSEKVTGPEFAATVGIIRYAARKIGSEPAAASDNYHFFHRLRRQVIRLFQGLFK